MCCHTKYWFSFLKWLHVLSHLIWKKFPIKKTICSWGKIVSKHSFLCKNTFIFYQRFSLFDLLKCKKLVFYRFCPGCVEPIISVKLLNNHMESWIETKQYMGFFLLLFSDVFWKTRIIKIQISSCVFVYRYIYVFHCVFLFATLYMLFLCFALPCLTIPFLLLSVFSFPFPLSPFSFLLSLFLGSAGVSDNWDEVFLFLLWHVKFLMLIITNMSFKLLKNIFKILTLVQNFLLKYKK